MAAIPLVTQGIAHEGRLPTEACAETRPARKGVARRMRDFMSWGCEQKFVRAETGWVKEGGPKLKENPET